MIRSSALAESTLPLPWQASPGSRGEWAKQMEAPNVAMSGDQTARFCMDKKPTLELWGILIGTFGLSCPEFQCFPRLVCKILYRNIFNRSPGGNGQ